MKAVFLRAGAILLAVSLAGCETTSQSPGAPGGTEVTRFHLGGQIARGPIAIEAADPSANNSAEFRTYADIVAGQLTRLGWTVMPNVGSSEQVAIVNVAQGSH